LLFALLVLKLFTLFPWLDSWTEGSQFNEETLNALRDHALTVRFNDAVNLQTKQLLKETIALHHVVHIRKLMLDRIKDSMKKYGVNRFLASKPYLPNENFPSNEEHIYAHERILRPINFTGSDQDRMRILFGNHFAFAYAMTN
jgi:hypothetical protein